jgi:hypothetical protein
MIFVVAALIRLPSLLEVRSYGYVQTAPLPRLFFPYLTSLPNHIFWSLIISGALVCIQALVINYIMSRHGVLYKDTALPGLFFVVLNSLYPEQMQLTPQLISNTFLILLFQRLCYLYESTNPLLIVLDAGMYLGLGILFNYDLSVFLPFILVSVVIFTSFNLRYLAVSVLGILIPLYFTAVIFYLTDNLGELLYYVKLSFQKSLLNPIAASVDMIAPLVPLIPVLLVSAFELQRNYFRNKVKTRRIWQCIALMVGFGVLGLFIDNTNFLYAFAYLSVPLCMVIAYYFISTRRLLLKEVLFLALIGLSLYYQFR